jgi:hypothetical protein
MEYQSVQGILNVLVKAARDCEGSCMRASSSQVEREAEGKLDEVFSETMKKLAVKIYGAPSLQDRLKSEVLFKELADTVPVSGGAHEECSVLPKKLDRFEP